MTEAATDALRVAMARLDIVFREGDSDLAETCVHPDFRIVTTTPQFRVLVRADWVASLAEYKLLAWDVREERLDITDDLVALHHRRAWRESRYGDNVSAGEISVSDSWMRRADGDWMLWQRMIANVA